MEMNPLNTLFRKSINSLEINLQCFGRARQIADIMIVGYAHAAGVIARRRQEVWGDAGYQGQTEAIHAAA
jgi:hypothetical protein